MQECYLLEEIAGGAADSLFEICPKMTLNSEFVVKLGPPDKAN
jgi:hypothetical protein